MGITIVPKERDESSDISRLEIKFPRGSIESPSRFITKVDLNAKDGIGADIPLSRTRKLFLYEEFINPKKLQRILNENGYLAVFQTNFRNFLSRVERADALRLVYPKFTKDGLAALESIGESNRNKVWTFFFQLISELATGKEVIDGFFVQYDHLTPAAQRYIAKQDLPFIPTIDIHGDFQVVRRQLNNYASFPSSLVPFIGLNYSTLTRSNLAYQEAISMLDSLHESGKGFITIDAPRVSGKRVFDPDISALHYSNFVVADLAAEKTYGGGSGGEPNVRLFEKGDLAVPVLHREHNAIEHSGEDGFLQEDPKLRTLLDNMFQGTISPSDSSRAVYLSRVHENIITGMEYANMRKSIVNNELLHYRTEKYRINAMLLNEGR
jgi:hypothetical protein